ncbi:Cyclic di-GMP phosphodiesterase Gmr [Marinomonas gallaica]|uniref:Cyclic di-GMP phosphodiesterase Gmr n=1 Tax=Marinomonas gallaica TaxID=1806667 RepID=A0A1C3JL69_9GAMM|nr:EAL domain-containing protein [Marinomonas gallaica]SBT15942.1 Cyclic di-GMP phosphodiesterase Gmr [Marinomonas gallaica]SBT20990.1 Cyclic di-GMP phosphodiesterase Gmr [Marinomonas gallaica]
MKAFTVLIVDDVPDNIDVLRKVLAPLDCKVSVATSAERALSILEQLEPELMLLDVMMPGMSGFDLCSLLRKDPRFKETPIIFVTGRTDDISQGFAVGGNDYITKPINTDEVIARVTHHKERHQMMQQLRSLNSELEERVRQRTAELVTTNKLLREEINERRYMQDRLKYLADHDFVSRTHNRKALEYFVVELISQSQDSFQEAYYLSVDLSRFRVVNESCGLIAGDELLSEAAELISLIVGSNAFVARLSGDSFAIVYPTDDCSVASSIANQLHEEFSRFRFFWGERHFDIGATLAVVKIDQSLTSFDQVLMMADEVMFSAKRAGGQCVSYFSDDNEQANKQNARQNWALRLIDALKYDHFRVYFQQICPLNAQSNGIRMETLVRLYAPDQEKILFPDSFLFAAERYQLIADIDRWMIRKVCEFLRDHPVQQQLIEQVALNLSATTLRDAHLVDYIQDVLEKYSVNPRKLCFEVTETEQIIHVSQTSSILEQIKQLGCSIAIDDFGSGYSSFSYLRDFPFDHIKIDGIFAREIEHSDASMAMVQSILDVAKKLNKPCVVEFVENQGLADLYQSMGIEWGQGYHFHKPEPLNAANVDLCLTRAKVCEESN